MQALLEILYTNNLSKSYKEPVRYASVALCAVSTSVTLHYLRPLRDSVCPLYKPFSLSLHISKEPLITLYHVSHYPVPCLPLLCYHVSYYPITMSLITLSHVSHYSVTMSLITLSHAFHYPVTMSLITLSPSGNAKPQKRVDKLIIPRSHTPQNN